jgi:hypothetical protein
MQRRLPFAIENLYRGIALFRKRRRWPNHGEAIILLNLQAE